MARECGKVVTECRAEVVEGLHMIQYVFGTGRMPIGEVLASEIAEKDAFMRRKPWGVVAVITPWNFPFAVPLWMLGPSLLEGNTAVFKPSEDTPAIGQRIGRAVRGSRLSAGRRQSGPRRRPRRARRWCAIPASTCVLFTGSYDVGKRIQRNLGRAFHDRIVACEMGSKSAVIVCEDARLDLAVTARHHQRASRPAASAASRRGGSSSHEKLIDRYRREVRQRPRNACSIGDPLDADNFTGPVINKAAVEKVERYNELAKEEGAEILLDGGRMTDGDHADGCYPVAVRLSHRARPRAFAASAKRCSARTWP